MSIYQEILKEPWFSLVNFGIKKVEGRLNMSYYKLIKKDDIIEFYNSTFEPRFCKCKVIKIDYYLTFTDFLQDTLDKSLPSISKIEEGLKIYHEYYTKTLEKQFGIVCFHLELI